MLEVSDLRSGYGRIPILDGVTLSIAPGEVVGILGHNGMGKTTLLRTLIGQIKATAGSILLEGREVARLAVHRRARAGMGYVPQGRDIFPQLSVRENLKMGEMAGRGENALGQVLAHFPILEELLDRPGQALSGGQQQILALARCLTADPKLILLDEPTEGIQPSIVDLIAEKLIALRQALGLTVLLVEQDLHFIQSLADRVLIIQKGRIVAEILPEQLSDRAIIDEYLGI